MKPIRVFNHTLHKQMWNWLANHPDCEKEEWPGLQALPEKQIMEFAMYHYCCFACWVAGNDDRNTRRDMGAICKSCPLDWGAEACWDDGELYDAWIFAGCDYDERKDIARQIAELPLKENENFITITI